MNRMRDLSEDCGGSPLSELIDISAVRGVILVDSSPRRQYALAYRAAVDAVYAEAALDAVTRATSTEAKHPDMASTCLDWYKRSADPPPHKGRAGEHPVRWSWELSRLRMIAASVWGSRRLPGKRSPSRAIRIETDSCRLRGPL
jgi:hypothetical protein